MKLKNKLALILMLLVQITSKIQGQNVDIQLRNAGSTLEVWLIPKANYSGVVSSLTFTISWDAAYNVDLATAGKETLFVPAIPLQAAGNAAQTSVTNGLRKYRTYSSSGGGASISVTNNAAFRLISVPVPRTSTIPTGQFSISNDAFILANNLNYYFEIGGNDYTGKTSSIALAVPIPLELISFKAIEQDNAAYLTWKTASEIDFSHFEVERSADAKDWTKIGEIKGGNTEGSYFLTDEKAFNENTIAFYRLKMVNMDGNFKYANVVSVVQKEQSKGRIKLYPNPTHNDVQLMINVPNVVTQTVDIIDAFGKLYQRAKIELLKGQNLHTIDVRSLPSGTYFVKTFNNKGIKEVIPFIKL